MLDSVFQEISLHDTLCFKIEKATKIEESGPTIDIDDIIMHVAVTAAGTVIYLDCGDIDIPASQNLIFRALDAMEQAFDCALCASDKTQLNITVEKHIPAGGGLGGGSSNAAAAIRAYCKLCGFDVNDKRALKVAQSLGADVAFFLQGGAALMKGRGDVLDRVLPSFPLPLVLMGSDKGCNTGLVYRTFDEKPIPAPDAEMLAQAMEDLELAQSPIAKSVASMMLADRCKNNLAPAAYAVLPQLQERIDCALKSKNVLGACVTGSGSTCFAVCGNEETAQNFAKEAAGFCDWVKVVQAL